MQLRQSISLQQPDAISAEHSRRVAAHVQQKIAAAGGCISFAAFMHEVLYAPGLGYYSAGATKLGAAGDFVTAPEISSLFGYVLARQCAPVLAELHGQQSSASLLEIGAGSGKLAADLLTRLASLDALPVAYQILEVSADLADRQAAYLRKTVPELAGRVTWLREMPASFRGVMIANEVIDALPVERFVRHVDHVAQLCVAVEDGVFVNVERPAPPPLAAAVAAIETEIGARLPEGYVSEINLAAPKWLASLAAGLQQGALLLFDYGVSRREYYAPDRSDGWLRCHFRHQAHADALLFPGIQDITAWVDFSAIAGAAMDAGLTVEGYVSQAHFLMNGGLVEELQHFTELPPDAQVELSAQVKLLTLPGEMGENFKCLGLSRDLERGLASLETMDRTLSL
jgi:SAM-dependent MidA family methyltransferase